MTFRLWRCFWSTFILIDDTELSGFFKPKERRGEWCMQFSNAQVFQEFSFNQIEEPASTKLLIILQQKMCKSESVPNLIN